MLKQIHRISDNVFFKSIFLIVIFWNLKYFFLPLQVPFTLIAKDFIWNNSFYSTVTLVREAASKITDFQDEGQIGFVSDVPQGNIFDQTESIRDFYTVQYAVVPSILKNDKEHNFVVADFEKETDLPVGYTVQSKINKKLYILKKEDN